MEPNKDDRSCIGLFDSGVGGLTVMQEIKRLLPREDIIYFGDTARIPYGGKSRETVIRYSIENAVFLMEKQIKLLVVACNTASAFALDELRQLFTIPILGVIEPGAEKAVAMTRRKRIAVLGTKGTILSEAYQKTLRHLMPEATIISIACPLFVPLVEENFIEHPATRLIVQDYLRPLKGQNIDTLLLGCTHYPFLKKLIQEEVGPDVTLVDSASSCAEKVAELLDDYCMKSPFFTGSYHYFVSDDPEKFCELGKKLFGHPLEAMQAHASQERLGSIKTDREIIHQF